MNQTYPFELTPLPYAYNALEPYIDEETMKIHHDRHLQAFVNNLNAILKDKPEYQDWTLEQLLRSQRQLDAEVRIPIVRNAGGIYNHENYFNGMTPDAKASPNGSLSEAIAEYYGSFADFKRLFSNAAASVFGSGYAFLTASPQGWLQIITLANQETPIFSNYTPILTLDVWEHAYYLDYQNRRADYINNWWNIVNWSVAEGIYDAVLERSRRTDLGSM